MQTLPEVITLSRESATQESYDNHPIARVNDHVVRISTMTSAYDWHFHPNSDEVFLVLEGTLVIEFEEGSVELQPGQMITVNRGIRHRTRPAGPRSVNLTLERADTQTQKIPS